MDNLIVETNSRLKEIIENLTTIKTEYEDKLKKNNKDIDAQLEKVRKYKAEFFESKAKIEKMNVDIEGFETDYQKLVERFKDDELANILIAANKEISLKIDERKRKIIKDKTAMNELVDKAESVKSKLVKLTAEKKALELCLNRILDAYDYYSESLGDIIDYSTEHKDNLCSKYNTTSDESIDEYIANHSNIGDDSDSTDDNEHTDENIDINEEEIKHLEPVDISDMVKDEDIETSVDLDDEKKDDENTEEDNAEETDIDLDIDVDFDDSLEDDDSLYE